MASGVTVELDIEDEVLAHRVEAMLHELGIAMAGRHGTATLAITDVVPPPATAGTTILLADDVEPVAVLQAGVAGLLPKTAEIADLRIALDAALRGLAVVRLGIIDGAAGRPPLFEDPEAADSIRLTARETEVLSLLAEGASNKTIARKLAISVHTAKFHVASILEKL